MTTTTTLYNSIIDRFLCVNAVFAAYHVVLQWLCKAGNTCSCSFGSFAVDGGWSDWLAWQQCDQVAADDVMSDVDDDAVAADKCLCRHRDCSSPKPAHGGLPCRGKSMEVTNCTRKSESDLFF